MEGLVSSGINTIRVFGVTKHQSRFLHSSMLHLRSNRVCGTGIGVEEKKKRKQCFVMAASVGGSKVGHFENTLPSKEVLELWRKGDAVCPFSLCLCSLFGFPFCDDHQFWCEQMWKFLMIVQVVVMLLSSLCV
ncbi:uncharacterized protein LOC114167084 [Vigna unguiculata]|uniref:uncharacterized protein LOC114167084 n=1 Tax=Vigna unguiculata TaxID=3917 RepID=UPI0010160DB1|nr:uncharacterized protein LOC114167084 [Vigna unguiculata]